MDYTCSHDVIMVNICINCGFDGLLPSLQVLYSTMNDRHSVLELKRGALLGNWALASSQFV